MSKSINCIDFEETFNHFQCCTFTKDMHYRYTFVNDAVCKLFALKKEQVIGKKDSDFFDLDVSHESSSNDKTVLSGTPISKIEVCVLKNQKIKYFQVVKSPLFSEDGCIKGLLGIAIDISGSILKSNQLEFLATHDQLTGVFNRGYLELHLKQILCEYTRQKKSLSLMMIDIDNFKFINDNYGHTAGDKVLKEIGTLLRQLTRDEDICCRYGGDEFTIFLPNTSLYNAYLLGERIRRQVSNFEFSYSHVKSEALKVRISIGISFLDHSLPNELLLNADLALLDAKYRNKNTTIANCTKQSALQSCNNCPLKKQCVTESQ